MTTNELRELAGVSLVSEPALPSESKHTLDDRRDEARLHRREAKELRLLDNPMVEYKQGELVETLWNPRDIVMKQLKEWNYTTEKKAPYGPYRHAS